MSMLDKDAYERKEAWAARRMAENAEIETLTEEQHDYLSSLCSFRHNLHTNKDSIINENSGEYEYYASEINEYYEDEDSTFRAEGFRLFGEYPFMRKDYLCLEEIYEEAGEECDRDEDEDGYRRLVEEKEMESMDTIEKINNDIERFLAKIDKQHGTDYCPTGATRLF